jgi:tetratricopeptide (TPR) repeat protein
MIGLGLAALLLASSPSPLVRHPPLDGLEAAVAEQLRHVRAGLEEKVSEGRAKAGDYGEAGAQYHAYEIFPAAEDCYRNAETLAPEDHRWPHLLGLLFEQDGRFEEAATAFERALRRAAFYPALVRLAALYLRLGRLKDAAPLLETARRHSPDDPALLAVMGEHALAEARPRDAIRHLSRALEKQPRATRLHYPLAMAHRSVGDMKAAATALARAGTAGVHPKDPLLEGVQAFRRGAQAYVREAERAEGAGDHAAAAAAYRRALAGSAEPSLSLLLASAAAEIRLARFSDALDRLMRAREMAPDDDAVLYNLGVVLGQLQRYDEARATLERLVRVHPDDDAARIELIVVLLGRGLTDEARRHIELRFHPPFCASLLRRLEPLDGAATPQAELAPLLRRCSQQSVETPMTLP